MPAVIRVTLISSIGDQDLYNTFAWVGPDQNVNDAEALADIFAGILALRFETNMTTGLAGYQAVLNLWNCVPGTPLLPGIPFTPTSISGDETSHVLPQGTSLLLNFKSYNLPPNRKRLYIGGFCENVNENGVPSLAMIAQGNLAVADLLETQVVNANDWFPCVLRLSDVGAYVAHHILDSGFTSVNWARLRSRRSR